MKLEEAQNKLLLAREQQKKLRVEIEKLKEIIIGYGAEPDQRFKGLNERNNEIYKLHQEGLTFTAIAKQYNLSNTRITNICKEIDYKKAIKNSHPKYQRS